MSSSGPIELYHFGSWLINNRLNISYLLTLQSVALNASTVRKLVEIGIDRKYSGTGHKLGMPTNIPFEQYLKW